MNDRWGVFVNGEKVREFSCPRVAEDYMDELVDEVTETDPTASFDVIPLSPEEQTR